VGDGGNRRLFGKTLLNWNHKRRHIFALSTFAVLFALSAASPTFAQGSNAKPATEKWRPKDGTYAEPGANFNARCGEFGDTQIEWAENSINGGEEGCKIVKLSDTAPGAIRLDVICTDIEREKPYKEIVLLKKMNEKTIFLRETQNGKFKRPGGKMSYCPEDAQRSYTTARARDKAEAEQKAPVERSKPEK